MQDIIIDDRRQLSAKAVSRENQANPKSKYKRGLILYLVDLFTKSIIVAALLCINFTLFVNAGSYNMFFANQPQITLEVTYIVIGIVVFSGLLMYLISFSHFLQNLVSSLIIGGFLLAIFNQFAIFDTGSILANSVGNFFSGNFSTIFDQYSHLIIAGLVSLFFMLFFSFAGRTTIAYFMGIMLFILGGLVADSYLNNRIHRDFNVTYEQKALVDEKADGKNFVFIALPGLASYNSIKEFSDSASEHSPYNAKVDQALDNLLGFYAQNKFSVYPNSYVRDDNAFVNFTQMLNPQNLKDNPRENTLNSVSVRSYWDFKNLSNKRIYLKNNKLFDIFRKNKYDIKVFESRGVELCLKNNEMAVNKCVQKANVPISFNKGKFTIVQKTVLLLNQWLESTELFATYAPFYKALRMFGNVADLPASGFSSQRLYVDKSLETFDLLTAEIKKDKGNTAYFAFIDLPSNLYIYDQYCQLKPMSSWISRDNVRGIIPATNLQKKEAYVEQLSCLYGRLENFMQDLSISNERNNTVVIIQGISGAKGLINSKTDFHAQMKANRQVTTAIFDPLKKDFANDEKACQAAAILRGYLFKTGECIELDDMNLAKNPRQELLAKFKDDHIPDDKIFSAQTSFINWYQEWANVNNVENNAFSAAVILPPKQLVEEKIVTAAPLVTSPQEQPEAAVIPLVKIESKAENKPERKISVKAKVIDKKVNTVNHDVVPPFVEGK